METYIKIDDDTLKRVYTDENIIDLRIIRARVQAINSEIEQAKLEPRLVNNDMRDMKLEELRKEKEELLIILRR